MIDSVINPQEVEADLVSAIAELGAEPELITRDAELQSLEVDSLDIVELGQMIDERYGLEIRAEDVKDVKTVGELFDVVIATIQRAS